jgi:membrane protease YdiL (CAAX protease family)
LILAVFVLLQIFRLIHLLLPSKSTESVLVIPFQLLIFLLPAFLFAKFKNPSAPLEYLLRLRMRAPRVYQLPLVAVSVPLLISGCLLLSIVFGGIRSLSDGFTLYNTFISQTGLGFFETLYLMLAYAAIPAICEELIFRAILCREFEKHGAVCAIGASAIFFALLHFDLALFPVYLFAGILLALSMYATGSAIVPMIIHFFYNLIGLFGQPFLTSLYKVTGGSLGLFSFITLMLCLLFAALFCSFASKSYARRAEFSKMPYRPILPSAGSLVGAVSDVLLTPWSISAVCFYIVVILIYSLF